MNPVVHFEMPYQDKERMAHFYRDTFGWQPQMLGPEMGNYVTVNTSELDMETKMPTEPGRINGGFFQKTRSSECTSIVIQVDDIDEAIRTIRQNKGTVLGREEPGKPDEIPGIGLYIAFLDTEGNKVGILQPTAKMLFE